MAVRETPAEQIERLLRTGDPAGAARVAGEMLAKLPASPIARIGRARALLQLGRFAEAEADIEVALRSAPKDEGANYLRGTLDIRNGKADEGIARLKPIALGRGPHALEAMFAVVDMMYHTNRRDEWRELMKTDGAWRKDIRAAFHLARLAALDDPMAGAAAMKAVLRNASLPPHLRRHAGFEAAGLLDKAGQYRDAFDTARETHATTGDDFDIDQLMKPLLEQAARVEQGERWITPQVDPVEGVVLLVSLPRSGTTLLEQMLDRHPAISGIGEYEGLAHVYQELKSQPSWPRRPNDVPKAFYAEMQRRYLAGANHLRREGASFTFDKGLRTWRSIPEVAAILPGALCISVDRDPRDMATSLFLSYFSVGQIAWTLNFDAMRRVIEVQRRLLPRAMEVLGVAHESIVYEDLVEDPSTHAERCLSRLGLQMDERVLNPEHNTRAATTLSAMQVRKPINRSSIGRWKNYAWAFDDRWEALVEGHEKRRAKR